MAKGAKNCCCTGCEELPATSPQSVNLGGSASVTFKGHPIDLAQQYCCDCFPKEACVALYDYNTNQNSIVMLRINCNTSIVPAQNGFGVLYEGSVDFAGMLVDLTFVIEVVDSVCYLALTSYALGIHDSRVAITAALRAHPFHFCRSLCNQVDAQNFPLYTEWIIGHFAVRISATDLTPITRRRPCLDSYGKVVLDTDPIKGVCQGCACLCTVGCVITQHPKTNVVITSTVVLTGDTYLPLSQYGPSIQVVKDLTGTATNNCALKLLDPGDGFVSSATPPLVDITAGTAPHSPTDCPTPTAHWGLTDAGGAAIIVDFYCATCDDCANITSPNPGCCVGFQLPRVLHCTISKGENVPSALCECLPITLPLVYQGTGAGLAWLGLIQQGADGGGWCVGNDQGVKVLLSCAAPGWTLRFGDANFNATPCAGTISSSYEVCDPFHLTFDYHQTGPGSCCGPSPSGGPLDIIFTITE